MKRVRGVDEVTTPIGVTQKHSSQVSGIGGVVGVGNTGNNLEYHTSGIVTGVTSGQSVRQLTSKEMPGSIQFGTTQTQQQYAESIIMPTAAAPSPVKVHANASAQLPPAAPSNISGTSGSQQQFQRLKVEDALSYLDQVKYKFNDQPQVYNDFLDIMREFKSQSIDTPGVITRVSNLFKGHPELIVGFNTFLPPGYKIEVQANEQGYAFQVSVSMPSPTATHTSTISQHHCTVDVGSPPVASPPSQPAKAPSVLQIMQGGGNIHHSMTNNIANNTVTMHATVPSPPPVQTYNNSHISAAQAQAVSQALSQAQDGVQNCGTVVSGQTQQSQPVEFNHAINYVNKIKNRFQGQPDKYKHFLGILHTYQKEQRSLKEAGQMGGGSTTPTGGKHLTEAEVYSQVAKLFENQDDLLAEFGQFLPDATSQQSALSAAVLQGNKSTVNDHSVILKKPLLKTSFNNTSSVPRDHRSDTGSTGSLDRDRDHRDRDRDRERPSVREVNSTQKFGHNTSQLKRSPSFPTSVSTGNSHHSPHGPPPPKKHKVSASVRDITIAEAAKYGTLNDFAFFDKLRKALRLPEVYENFLRCLSLFNQEIISKSELLNLTQPFLARTPELHRWFKDYIGHTSDSPNSSSNANSNNNLLESLPNNVVRSHQDRPQGDLAMEIDYTTCKRLGASYCALPKSYMQPKCSGRTQLCREVLNDTWVSFPTWSEDGTFVTSRKTQFEEFIYRCEDERFELDGVIETNAATIRVLEGVHKKMNRMSPEELQRFKLDDCLGGSSPTIHQRAIKRIYGDKAQDIIDGLKKNPVVAVPVVLRRLKNKEEEWREAQKGFNKIWREQNEKYYLKSLDHQGINFKQNDVKALRSKSLFNEIEALLDEGDHHENGGPHMVLPYKDKSVLDDAANLLIHHVKRQTAIHKEDKQRIKLLLRHFIPDLFFHPRQELSDDERDDDDDKDDSPSGSQSLTTLGLQGSRNKVATSTSTSISKNESDIKVPVHALSDDPEEAYTLFMGSNNWYLFLRLHHILCERLTKMYDRAVALADEEVAYKQQRKESAAVALRLKPKSDVEIEDYYPTFLDMVKNVLDGNMESTSYEDTLREMFGIHAYVAFTLDKVVSYAVRQLQHLVTDAACQQCMELFNREQRQPKENTGAGGLCATAYMRIGAEMAYQRRAEATMGTENSFKIYIYKKECKMTIELLDNLSEDTPEGSNEREREDVNSSEKWSSYVERYSTQSATGGSMNQSSPKDTPRSPNNEPQSTANNTNHPVDGNGWSSLDRILAGRKPVFLYRNVRRYKNRAEKAWRSVNSNTTDKSADSAEGEKSEENDSVGDSAKSPVRITADGSDMITQDETECTFTPTSYHMVYVSGKEAFIYKRMSLLRAKETHPSVTRALNTKFHDWLSTWASKNVADSQHRLCQDWLMGRYENLIPQRTRVITDNDQSRTPYRSYNRYRVERLVKADSEAEAT